MRKLLIGIVPLLVVAFAAAPAFARVTSAAPTLLGEGDGQVATLIYTGELETVAGMLDDLLAVDADNANAAALRGMVRFLQAVEQLGQSLHHHGLYTRREVMFVPVLRMPVPENPQPEPISAGEFRGVLQQFADDLAESEALLSKVGDHSVKLPIQLGRVRLDLDGDGEATEAESLGRLFAELTGRGEVSPEEQARFDQFVIGFDAGDVYWLRGYCQILMAIGETALAHDVDELFERTAHMFFLQVETPHGFLHNDAAAMQFSGMELVDFIALIHLLDLDVVEPQRMHAALAHLEAVTRLSRKSWTSILAETDDDHEWVPNPKQATVMPGFRVTDAMVEAWMTFLDESEAILAGDKLVPFWRVHDGQTGVNIRKVFTEPTGLDLVLWVQGTAATPYLEKGELTTPAFWDRLNATFGGNFLGFAAWVN